MILFKENFVENTCSAARGSRFKIKFAASLFFAAIEQANGVWFCLLRIDKSKLGAFINRLIIAVCWLIMATCNGVFASAS